MRMAAVILPDLGTGSDTPIVVSYWFAVAENSSGKGSGWSKYWSVPLPSTFPRRQLDAWSRSSCGRMTKSFREPIWATLRFLTRRATTIRERVPVRTERDHGRAPSGGFRGPGHRAL